MASRSSRICAIIQMFLAVVAVTMLPKLDAGRPNLHDSDCGHGFSNHRHRDVSEEDSSSELSETLIPSEELRKAGSAIFAALRHSDQSPDSVTVTGNIGDPSFISVNGMLNGQTTALHRTFDSRVLRIIAERTQKRSSSGDERKGRCKGNKVCMRIKKMRRHRKRLERIQRKQDSDARRHSRGWRRTRKNEKTDKMNPSVASSTMLKSNRPPIVITKASHLRRDWCRTDPLKQRVTEHGCRSEMIMNNFCYGQCNSFYIPKPSHDDIGTERNGTAAFQSCAFCKPLKTSWLTVTLRCPGLIPPFRTKRVMRVDKCRCQSELLR